MIRSGLNLSFIAFIIWSTNCFAEEFPPSTERFGPGGVCDTIEILKRYDLPAFYASSLETPSSRRIAILSIVKPFDDRPRVIPLIEQRWPLVNDGSFKDLPDPVYLKIPTMRLTTLSPETMDHLLGLHQLYLEIRKKDFPPIVLRRFYEQDKMLLNTPQTYFIKYQKDSSSSIDEMVILKDVSSDHEWIEGMPASLKVGILKRAENGQPTFLLRRFFSTLSSESNGIFRGEELMREVASWIDERYGDLPVTIISESVPSRKAWLEGHGFKEFESKGTFVWFTQDLDSFIHHAGTFSHLRKNYWRRRLSKRQASHSSSRVFLRTQAVKEAAIFQDPHELMWGRFYPPIKRLEFEFYDRFGSAGDLNRLADELRSLLPRHARSDISQWPNFLFREGL